MEIDCCGHGLLCCASSWIKRWGGRDGVLVMNGSEVYCRTEGEHTWLGFEPLATQPFEIPRWCRHYFPVAPEGAAIAGTENGYLLLRWPAGFELATLPRPGAVLGRHTRRSLIVTCAVAAPPAPVSVHYRYFAPQYGVDEDAATGSAMRILANFWQHCGLGAALTAYQCSKEGGILFSRVEQGKVWVGGNVATMEEETAAVD